MKLPGNIRTDGDGPVAAAVRRQQQILLARQTPLMIFLNMLVAVVVAFLLSGFAPLWQALLWLGAMLAASGYFMVIAHRLRKRPLPQTVTGRTLKRAEYWAAGMGLLWAGALFIFYVDEPARYNMFLALVMVGLAYGCVSMLQTIPRVAGWFAATLLAPMIVRFVAVGDPLHLIVAILAVIFFFAAMSASQRAYRQLTALVESSVALERARSDLVDAIESIKDAFAIYDADGVIKLANDRFRSWFGHCEILRDVPGTAGLHRMPGGVWLQGYVRPMTGGSQVSVHTDVTALKNRERELIAAKLEAEEASNAKSHFLANVSHELRTPLNAIMGFADMMRRGVFGPLGTEKYCQYAEDIHDSAAQLLAVINDILNLSRIQSSGHKLTFEEVDVSELVTSVAETCAYHDNDFEAPRRIDVDICPEVGRIRADPDVLRQVLLNLVRNAVKFTPRSGQVAIRTDIDDLGRPRILVSDTGIGISEDRLESVRQPFEKAEGTFERRFPGMGLGLTISDALVRLHGGELEMESELGKGTRVSVILPADVRIINRPQARAS